MKPNHQTLNSKQPFNDLLLPVIAVLCLLPFVIYLAEYDTGFCAYVWSSANSVLQDLYTWYRAHVFLIIVFFSIVILLFRTGLYKERTKNNHIFLPLAAYSIFVILSAIFTSQSNASWLYNGITSENTFVLLGYGFIGFYTYQILEQESDYRSLIRTVCVMFLLISIIGWLQVFQHDLLTQEWVQKLIMSDRLFAVYGGTLEMVFTGNNVFLTLYNPNYAAIFLVMFTAVFSVFFLWAKNKKERILFGLFLLDSLFLCWCTYTRAALVALGLLALILILVRKECGKKRWLIPAVLAVFLLVLFGADALNGGKYLGRIIDEKKDTRLETIITSHDGVSITYDNETYLFSLENKLPVCVKEPEKTQISLQQTQSGDYLTPFSETCYVNAINYADMEELIFLLNDYTLEFAKSETGYVYITEWGKTDSMVEIPHVNLGGLEYLGSGRLYIWSRVLPMLKNYLVIGSGPDTFAYVFPQNDYVGKMIYAENTARIMERAHNAYLTHWIQTGLLSLVALLVFYALFLYQSAHYYSCCLLTSTKNKLGFGCFLGCTAYLICGLFNDSTLYTTPVFYVFVGISLAAAYEPK